MKVRVNGVEREVREDATLAGLVAELGISGGVVAELNREIVRPDGFANAKLKDGDAIELVRFVGGG